MSLLEGILIAGLHQLDKALHILATFRLEELFQLSVFPSNIGRKLEIRVTRHCACPRQ
jgi:hypothetical protein